MKKLVQTILLIIAGLNIACSQHYRTSDVEIYDEEVYELLDEVVGVQGLNGMSVEDLDSSFTSYYVSKSGDALMGDVMSVLSFGYMDFLGFPGQSIIDVDPVEASVLFVDATSINGTRSYHLYFKMVDENGGVNIQAFHPTAADHFFYEEGVFEAYLSGTYADIVVYSDDLNDTFDEELAGTIQLKVDEIIDGERYHIGKIAVLAGFGGYQ